MLSVRNLQFIPILNTGFNLFLVLKAESRSNNCQQSLLSHSTVARFLQRYIINSLQLKTETRQNFDCLGSYRKLIALYLSALFQSRLQERMSNAWNATWRFLNRNPLRTVLIYSAAAISGFAVVDFTREIDIKMCGNFNPKSSNHLAESLEQLHSAASDGKIRYGEILFNRNRSIELHYISAVAEKHLASFKSSPELQSEDIADIQSMVARKNTLFTMRMCRRAMIRNGHVIKWFEAMVADELIKYYVKPVLSFFVIRFL